MHGAHGAIIAFGTEAQLAATDRSLAQGDVPLNAAQLAGDRAYRLFCRPDLSSYRSAAHLQLVARARPALARATRSWTPTPHGPVATYTLTPTGTPRSHVLIVHGWTSEAAFMAAFAAPLLQRGCRVVLFDHPAHGRSPQRAASLIDLARATRAVAAAHGPFDAALAHSIGCLATLLAHEGGAPLGGSHRFARLCLIAAPNRLSDIVARFAVEQRLSAAAHRTFARHVVRVGHRPLETFSSARLLNAHPVPTLLVHARDDDRVPFTDAEAITAACPTTELAAVDGLGHARVLYAPPVVRIVRSFLTDPTTTRG
ncbi:MAG: alpha/beta fold hydrolase [Pseudomonadota bacterium]